MFVVHLYFISQCIPGISSVLQLWAECPTLGQFPPYLLPLSRNRSLPVSSPFADVSACVALDGVVDSGAPCLCSCGSECLWAQSPCLLLLSPRGLIGAEHKQPQRQNPGALAGSDSSGHTELERGWS